MTIFTVVNCAPPVVAVAVEVAVTDVGEASEAAQATMAVVVEKAAIPVATSCLI